MSAILILICLAICVEIYFLIQNRKIGKEINAQIEAGDHILNHITEATRLMEKQTKHMERLTCKEGCEDENNG